MTKSEIKTHSIQSALRSELFDRSKRPQWDRFVGSCDRYATIAHGFQGARRVLDVGAEGGILLSLLSDFGHECYAVDITDGPGLFPEVYKKKAITFAFCNAEVDRLPFEDGFFDAVSCCQCLEHFTHSHLPAMREFYRVLKPGGLLEVDVPNVATFRNRSRILRGKNLTWDYEEHYLDAKPLCYKGSHFYPIRHNREFTRAELITLYRRAGFTEIKVDYLRSHRLRFGAERLKSLGTWLRDMIPSLRKTLIAYGRTPAVAPSKQKASIAEFAGGPG